MNRILLLGGTTEAVSLATAAAREPGTEVIYSLAGRTRAPILPDCTIRKGGFGGIDGLVAYLRENRIAALIDATHPYAAQMAAHARAAADAVNIPLFKFLRPAWDEPAHTPWHHAATPAHAARIIDGNFSRVFLSSGLGDISAFAPLSEIWFLVRSIDTPDAPLPLSRYEHIAARGPFDLENETELLRHWRIEALVTRNSGGAATAAKIEAARTLAIPIVMIDRPNPPQGVFYTEAAQLIDGVRQWLK
ncbi:MAG: cobalt-precorrin-6A reductase [Rhodospirillaceae bacterium]|jgi:precorrin-6A/cobalt-precorrin-6A reductase|nr:cobalt-precorrin-6A reductase [Rhodospirillaceae bacterium]MBT5458533.1 cobalt-precorrin-6A reductase [Rhodospirillaceae bacterium]